MTARHVTGPVPVQRLEGAFIMLASVVGTVVIAPQWWWMPLALFLVFDLSQLGYLRSAEFGAASYNAIHTYVWPAILAVAALATSTNWPVLSMWSGVIGFAWAFHVAADRALGYGLKLPDGFTHTHLGWIGKGRDNRQVTVE